MSEAGYKLFWKPVVVSEVFRLREDRFDVRKLVGCWYYIGVDNWCEFTVEAEGNLTDWPKSVGFRFYLGTGMKKLPVVLFFSSLLFTTPAAIALSIITLLIN